MARLTHDGYGQLELNNVAFRRDGRIEAQLPLKKGEFTAEKPAENGMILVVDRVEGCIRLPKSGDKLYVLNYTTEHMYDDRNPGLKNFKLTPEDGFYPRLGYLAVGDKFTTNCVTLGSGVTEDKEDIEGAYGVPSADGTILLQETAGEGLCLQAIEKTTMPDGQVAVKFIVISC